MPYLASAEKSAQLTHYVVGGDPLGFIYAYYAALEIIGAFVSFGVIHDVTVKVSIVSDSDVQGG